MTESTVAISGNTYPVKNSLRALGGKWDPDAKAWMVPADKADEARALVTGAGPGRTYTPRTRSRYTRFAGGGEHYVNRRGRCEDAPCCGCCS